MTFPFLALLIYLTIMVASSIRAQTPTDTPEEAPIPEPGTAVSLDPSKTPRQAVIDLAIQTFDQTGPKVRLPFATAAALVQGGRTPDAIKVVNAALDRLEPGNRYNRWMYGGNSGFEAWPGLDFYLQYKDRLDQPTRDRFARIYKGAVWYRQLTTSNHKMMAATERYLAAQEWGENFVPDPFFIKHAQETGKDDALPGTYFNAKDPTGRSYLEHRIQEEIASGSEEYASRPYGAQNVLTLLTVATCAKDPLLQKQAQMAYEVAIAELAGSYLQGHLATFSTRSYPDILTQQPVGIATVLWTYFGGVGTRIDWGLMAATSKYQLPEIFKAAGTDRTKPYVQRSRNGGWKLTTYMTPHYALFSRSGKGQPHMPVILGQNYPCGVMFVEPDLTRSSFLWITCPVADRNEDGPSIHTHGASNREEEVQREGTTLYVFNIDEKAPFPYALGFIPGSYQAMINESAAKGRIYLAYKSLLVALSSSTPFTWAPAAGLRFPYGKATPGDSEFRVNSRQMALALDTADPADAPGSTAKEKLAWFQQQVEAKSKLALEKTDKITGSYTDHQGHELTCVFGGHDMVDGQVVDYVNWPRLENPWMKFLG
jgi:hypothetical protein